MNTIWSDYIQGIDTLYLSRRLRFDDLFRDQYLPAFQLPDGLRMLEIGCGPGALCQALHRWYPNAEITGIDRDANFIRFARKQAPELTFAEADATQLPFPDHSFDVTISNTVAEHIAPEAFFGEQYRVLRPGGVCLMLSARRGVNLAAPCVEEDSPFEAECWQRIGPRVQEANQKMGVCAYPMSEMDYPRTMARYGFREITTEYAVINLTPDHPRFDSHTALAIIEANHRAALEYLDTVQRLAADVLTQAEWQQLRQETDQKFIRRVELYQAGEKQWDTNVSLTMILRGVK